ncbi:MAG: alpha/beta hydrolase [Bacteroidales bacterium]|nr:alpha/beta hydrolase [Bacteroidales bacterium]
MRKLSAILALSLTVLASSCGANTKLKKHELYRVTAAEESGYMRIEKRAGFSTWKGTFYLDGGKLMAESRPVTVKRSHKAFYFKNEEGRQPIDSLSKYIAPQFKEFPQTWEYRDSVYKVKVRKDVEYGYALGYWTDFPDSDEPFMGIYISKMGDKKKKDLPLTMDVYMPKDDDGSVLRPLLVLIHGGGFYNGNKTNAGYKEWGTYFASLGYTVASVNYRLGFHANKASIEKAGLRAVQDVNAAIRYIVHNKREFGVDPQRVFVAGTSAGAITALNVAYMRDENIPSSAKGEGTIDAVNPNLKDRFSIRGIGSMWGAVNDLSILNNANVPIIAFHSTGDPVVPFGVDHPFQDVFGNELITPIMFGDGEIIPYMKRLGRKAVLHKYDLPGIHSINIGEDFKINRYSYDIQYALRDFFADVMLPHPVDLRAKPDVQDIRIDAADISELSWAVEGGVIVEAGNKGAKVLLFPDAPKHTIKASGKYTSGLTFCKELEL